MIPAWPLKEAILTEFRNGLASPVTEKLLGQAPDVRP